MINFFSEHRRTELDFAHGPTSRTVHGFGLGRCPPKGNFHMLHSKEHHDQHSRQKAPVPKRRSHDVMKIENVDQNQQPQTHWWDDTQFRCSNSDLSTPFENWEVRTLSWAMRKKMEYSCWSSWLKILWPNGCFKQTLNTSTWVFIFQFWSIFNLIDEKSPTLSPWQPSDPIHLRCSIGHGLLANFCITTLAACWPTTIWSQSESIQIYLD